MPIASFYLVQPSPLAFSESFNLITLDVPEVFHEFVFSIIKFCLNYCRLHLWPSSKVWGSHVTPRDIFIEPIYYFMQNGYIEISIDCLKGSRFEKKDKGDRLVAVQSLFNLKKGSRTFKFQSKEQPSKVYMTTTSIRSQYGCA